MNCLTGRISELSGQGNLTLLRVNVNSAFFSVMVIENAQEVDFISIGTQVQLLFNESEVIIGKGISGKLSLVNAFKCRVLSIEQGDLFTRIEMDFYGEVIYSLITKEAFNDMVITENDLLDMYVKTNEILVHYS